jgi:hypothetical protein
MREINEIYRLVTGDLALYFRKELKLTWGFLFLDNQSKGRAGVMQGSGKFLETFLTFRSVVPGGICGT